MSAHPSEEDLILHHYGEGEDGPAVDAHLLSCPECAARREGLARVLAAVDAFAVPEPEGDYGARVWKHVRPQVKTHGGWSRRRPWMGLLAAAACLVVAFLLGRLSREVDVERAREAAGPARERVLLVAVGQHLERSQMVLVELENASGNGVIDISMERQRAEALLPDNRLYRQAAQRAGEAGVAGVLDDLERLLVEVATSPDTLPRAELEDLRRRMEEQGILFKLRVVGSEVRERGGEGAGRGSDL